MRNKNILTKLKDSEISSLVITLEKERLRDVNKLKEVLNQEYKFLKRASKLKRLS